MTPEEKQELRELCRAHLAERPRLALASSDVHRAVSRKLQCTIPEVADALELLVKLGQASKQYAKLGSTVYYQISADGQLAYERGEP